VEFGKSGGGELATEASEYICRLAGLDIHLFPFVLKDTVILQDLFYCLRSLRITFYMGVLKNIGSVIARSEATWLSRCHSIVEIVSLSLAMTRMGLF